MDSTLALDTKIVLDRCPVCAGDDLRTLEAEHDFHSFTTTGDEFVFRIGSAGCGGCGFIFLNPRASQEQMFRYYQRQSRIPRSADRLGRPYADLLDHQIRFIRRWWTPGPAPRILDVGCAEGFFLARLGHEAEGSHLEGVEPSPVYAAAAREVLPGAVIHEGMLEDVSLPEGSYDLITLRHVLEHLQDPLGALRMLASLLHPEGMLHVEVPDVTNWPASISSLYHHEHLNYFTPASMEYVFRLAGLEPVRLEAARDNPANSGFSYPIQRVMARAAAALADMSEAAAGNDVSAVHGRHVACRSEFIRNRLDPVRRRVSELRAEGRRVGIFGAGPHTLDLLSVLGVDDSTWTTFFDNNANKAGKLLRGVAIQLPTRESLALMDAVLVSSAEFEGEMVAQIESFRLDRLEILTLYP
jgi:2-polyprenyl-3-methyl-5-hydroxy-6-metoxy-1,4-benzoquinol methylase